MQTALALHRRADRVPVQTRAARHVAQRGHHALFHRLQAADIEEGAGVGEQPRQVGATLAHGVLHVAFGALRERLSAVCKRTLRKQVQPYVSYTARKAIVQEFTPSSEEKELYGLVAEYLSRPNLQALPQGQGPFLPFGVVVAQDREQLETITVVGSRMSYCDLLDTPAVAVRYDPSTAPGLF